MGWLTGRPIPRPLLMEYNEFAGAAAAAERQGA
jgi:hypothetical protein